MLNVGNNYTVPPSVSKNNDDLCPQRAFDSNAYSICYRYRTRAIITCGLYIFYPIFQCKGGWHYRPFNPIGTVIFLGQSWTGGGLILAPPPLLFQPWGIWGVGAKHDYCWLSSKDFFEIYNSSVAQNLTILETNMRFCWKSQKIRTIF